MLKIISQSQLPKPRQSPPKSWLGRLFSAGAEQEPATDLSTLLDYLKREELEATAQELHRLLPQEQRICWTSRELELFLSVAPGTPRGQILIETLSRHSRAVLSFSDDALPSPEIGDQESRQILTFEFSLRR